MTKKDYVLIARSIRPFNDPRHADPGRLTAEAIAQNIATGLAKDNPRFDRARFLEACGVTP